MIIFINVSQLLAKRAWLLATNGRLFWIDRDTARTPCVPCRKFRLISHCTAYYHMQTEQLEKFNERFDFYKKIVYS